MRENGVGMKKKKGEGLREVGGGRNRCIEVTMERNKVNITRNAIKQYMVVSFTTIMLCVFVL